MDEAGTLRAELLAQLPDSLEEWQTFNVADGPADLAKDEIYVCARIGKDEFLDIVRHVRNDLDRCAEIVAAALFLDDALIDASGRNVVRLARRHAGKALIMSKVQVGFGAVIGDIDLAMLAGAHRP